MDAVLFEVKDEIQRLKQDPEQITQEMFDHFMSRLQAVLEIDADHPEIQAVIQSLQTEYDQYARNSNFSGVSFYSSGHGLLRGQNRNRLCRKA